MNTITLSSPEDAATLRALLQEKFRIKRVFKEGSRAPEDLKALHIYHDTELVLRADIRQETEED